MQYSESAQRALNILRDPTHFEWYIVPIFAIVLYFYFLEIKQKNWNVVYAGLAYYGIEWLGEIANSLWMYVSGYAPLWGEPGKTAYLILVGINLETTLMFSIFGLAIAKLLPNDPKLKLWGLPNRAVVVLGLSFFCALVETILNKFGALTWDYWWWGWPHIWSVILFAYAPASAFAVVIHDMQSMSKKAWILLAVFTLDVILMAILIPLGLI